MQPSRLVYEMITRTRLNRVFDMSSLHDVITILAGADCAQAKFAAGFVPHALAAK
jgi:hypothetical protein